jgi:hypothetical protein
MKTIRTNTFETNSSSTHSVTIQTKGSGKSNRNKPLVDDQGRLVPKNLSSYTRSVGDATFTTCETKDQKAAIVINWLRSRIDDSDISEETVTKATEILVKKCGYTGVDEYNNYDFYPSTEWGICGDDDYIEKIEDELTITLTSFEKFIDDVILDDTKEIVDMDTPN